MIAHLKGKLAAKQQGQAVIDCGGVGYAVAVSDTTYAGLPNTGADCSLHTQLVVREDSMSIYGFSSIQEREFFLQLVTVQSVGPKVALAVLSAGTPTELSEAIALEDKAKFQSVSGIGKRTAERIVVELKDKVGHLTIGSGTPDLNGDSTTGTTSPGSSRLLARDSLVALGYQLEDADKLLKDIDADSVEELVAGALKASRR